MVNQYSDRITILDDQEIEELYGLPQFSHDERNFYFSLTPEERTVVDSHRTLANRVLFILQAGYFKAKMMFFTFEFDEVEDDVRHILQQHFPLYRGKRPVEAVAKQSRTMQQQRILGLYGYRTCDAAERESLIKKADQVVRISAKPIYLFQALIHYLETRRIVAPGYSFLQEIISQTMATERQRLTAILERALDQEAKTALRSLYTERESLYAITTLKHEPKDFSAKEMRNEIARSAAIADLYRVGSSLLPELGISNDSVTYYAALVDYYTVQKLQQLPFDMVNLYLLCFILYRQHKLNDNLINALIFHVRKVIDAAKASAQGRRMYQEYNSQHLS